jgi:crotonobetaine/carnitine-CoA ligase
MTYALLRIDPAERTIPMLLERQADALGERPCIEIGSVRLSYSEMRDAAAAAAGLLANEGVVEGDRVAVMAENCWETIALWAGCAWLGAILVPINAATRGAQLEHVLGNSRPRILAVDEELLAAVATVSALPDELEQVWTIESSQSDGSVLPAIGGLEPVPFPPLGQPVTAHDVRPGDTAAILYTSGTTGPSKGVCCPHAQFYWYGVKTSEVLGIQPDDVLYTCLPLFHINALTTFIQAVVNGAKVVYGPRFSASAFWGRLADSQATVTYLLGAMVAILAKTPPSETDSQHRVRVALAPATPTELHEVVRQRFGVRVVEGYAMTETNVVIGAPDGAGKPGYMGYQMPGFHVRVVDEADNPVPDGEPGELVMRADDPFAFSTGYWRMPEKTVEAWRNLWFHSGDRVIRDPDGCFRFLDRLKDAIRRRGENISAWEVEQVLQGHPDVATAAVIPVPSELGEDEVMACVVARDGARIEPLELVRYCEGRIAYFAIPRYIDLLAELPMTENGKVMKFVLRERGVTASSWDRDASGYTVSCAPGLASSPGSGRHVSES